MRFKRGFNLIVAIMLIIVTLLSLFTSCQKAEPAKIFKVSDMSDEELEGCLELSAYKDLDLLTTGSTGKADAVMGYIQLNSNVKKYPEGSVDYYVAQFEKQYSYYAEQAGISYEEMLSELGENDDTMRAEAERLVKKDLILELIRRKEGITLTDTEKSSFFDRYVAKYAESYGYSEDYVRRELSELVYESMLYDKTVEFLITHNKFSVAVEQSEQ